jgi:hypothetical protein
MNGRALSVVLALAVVGLLSACAYSYRDYGSAPRPSGYGIDDNYAPYHGTGERVEPVPD